MPDGRIPWLPASWDWASSLYYKMVERMNCIQNQLTIRNKQLIQKKVVAFVITGGQDNVQAVAGEMLGFFAELGFVFPPLPYIAHSLGWSAENMEKNVAFVKESKQLPEAARNLARRAVETARGLLGEVLSAAVAPKGGRKAQKGDWLRESPSEPKS
jgi:hypothetical protein